MSAPNQQSVPNNTDWRTCVKHLVTFHVRYGCWLCRNEKKGSM